MVIFAQYNIHFNMRGFLSLICAVLLFGCASHEQTLSNVREVATSEYNEVAAFTTFASIADKENRPRVANLFRALAEAQNIHFDQLSQSLKRLGDKHFTPSLSATPEDSTLSNLYKAHSSLQYDFYNIYPESIQTAEIERANKPRKLLSKIAQSKESSINYLEEIIIALEKNHSDSTLLTEWSVCKTCGNLTTIPADEKCGVCDGKHFNIHKL